MQIYLNSHSYEKSIYVYSYESDEYRSYTNNTVYILLYPYDVIQIPLLFPRTYIISFSQTDRVLKIRSTFTLCNIITQYSHTDVVEVIPKPMVAGKKVAINNGRDVYRAIFERPVCERH